VRTIRRCVKLHGKGWPKLLRLRGEIVIPKKAFEKLNCRAVEAGRQGVCQSAQRRGGKPAPARSAHHRHAAP